MAEDCYKDQTGEPEPALSLGERVARAEREVRKLREATLSALLLVCDAVENAAKKTDVLRADVSETAAKLTLSVNAAVIAGGCEPDFFDILRPAMQLEPFDFVTATALVVDEAESRGLLPVDGR